MRTKWIFVAACGLYLISVPLAQATDINAPMDARPTIGSEIKRGNGAAFDCGAKPLSDVYSLGRCVSNAISADQQKQPNSLPFIVGGYWGECKHDAILIEADLSIASTNSYAASEIPTVARELASSYEIFRRYQDQLGVTDMQLVEALDDITADDKVKILAQLQSWGAKPPQAPS